METIRKKQKVDISSDLEYLTGRKNKLIRYYFYLQNGLAIVNEFRNLILGIFAGYFALKLDNPLILVFMFVGAIIILIPTGYYRVHHISKVSEWLNTKFGSHYAIKNFDYVKAQYELLKNIFVEMKKMRYNVDIVESNINNMPLNKKGASILKEMKKTYGKEKGKQSKDDCNTLL